MITRTCVHCIRVFTASSSRCAHHARLTASQSPWLTSVRPPGLRLRAHSVCVPSVAVRCASERPPRARRTSVVWALIWLLLFDAPRVRVRSECARKIIYCTTATRLTHDTQDPYVHNPRSHAHIRRTQNLRPQAAGGSRDTTGPASARSCTPNRARYRPGARPSRHAKRIPRSMRLRSAVESSSSAPLARYGESVGSGEVDVLLEKALALPPAEAAAAAPPMQS